MKEYIADLLHKKIRVYLHHDYPDEKAGLRIEGIVEGYKDKAFMIRAGLYNYTSQKLETHLCIIEYSKVRFVAIL